MLRLFFASVFVLISVCGRAQLYSVALGVQSGFTVPYSLDQGIDSDPRYKARYTIKPAPVGLAFSMDFEGFGFIISPGIYTIGQNYHVVNTLGGHVGKREINLRYLSLPVAVKVHLIDLSFFRVSAIASFSGAFLYGAKDQISHNYSKLKFPPQTYPLLVAPYSQEYDGVIVPDINDLNIAEKDDYNSVQLFAGLGLRSDWDVSNQWRVSFDFRVNYGLFDPRTDEYQKRIKSFESIYETPGRRRDLFAHVSFGIARFLDYDKNDKDRAKKLKGSPRKYIPKKQSSPKRSKARS